MKPKFKVGPAKTRDGIIISILAIDPSGGSIVGTDSNGKVYIWSQHGVLITELGKLEHLDLMPNNEPEIIMFECKWSQNAVIYDADKLLNIPAHVRTSVTIVVLDE